MKVEYKSILSSEITSFFALRESRGFNERENRQLLGRLDKYLVSKGICEKKLDQETYEGWFNSLRPTIKDTTLNQYISLCMQFSKYLQSLGIEAFIPERVIARSDYIPYIFSEEQIVALIHAADSWFDIAKYKPIKVSAAQFSVVIRILYGCGMRLNEVLSLNARNIDTESAVIYVRNGKWKKDRIVPMTQSLNNILKRYIKGRRIQPDHLLFPARSGNKHTQGWARWWFGRVLATAGIDKPAVPKAARNICLHCIRHTFSVHSFRKMDLNGHDMYDEVPILSTYMGHARIYETEKYLSMSTENSSDIISKMEQFNVGIFPEVKE